MLGMAIDDTKRSITEYRVKPTDERSNAEIYGNHVGDKASDNIHVLH
jgi:hypothetical protein